MSWTPLQGPSCTRNDQCGKNGACGFPYRGANSLICCPSGHIDLWGGRDYCTGMTNGSPCWSDSMCSTGFCNSLVKGDSVCSAKFPNGQVCTSNFMCQSSYCVIQGNNGEQGTCQSKAPTTV